MQYSIATAISTILLASTLTTAVALPKPTTINVQEKTGDGDASVQQTIAVGSLQTKATNGQGLGSAVNAEVVDAGFTCQMFSDAKGTKKLGSAFDSLTTASFTAASDGSVDSQASAAVALGSICCAPTAQFSAVCGKFGSSASSGSNKGIFFDVRIQIDGEDELATQGEILADGFPQKLEAPLIGQVALSVSIVETPSNVECQAFYKYKKVGAPFNKEKEVDFPSTVNIDAVSCTQIL